MHYMFDSKCSGFEVATSAACSKNSHEKAVFEISLVKLLHMFIRQMMTHFRRQFPAPLVFHFCLCLCQGWQSNGENMAERSEGATWNILSRFYSMNLKNNFKEILFLSIFSVSAASPVPSCLPHSPERQH